MSKKSAFIFGFISLLLCGVGDWLIGYEPEGGEPLIYGITTTAISSVPTWFYVLSFFVGILSGFGCLYFAPAIMETLDMKGISRDSKMYKLMGFGLKSAPMMFVSFLTACGESWGYAFMCLAFYFAVNKEGKVNT